MDNKHLDASIFKYYNIFCNEEFEDILAGIIGCYRSIISNKILLPPNDENYIRDIILNNYLADDQYKNEHPPLCNYHFDKETHEKNGRVDIRILSVIPYLGHNAYYVIECKRLDNINLTGTTGLNRKYVSNGIIRFVSKTYPFYKKTAGMIGFVVAKMDIKRNIFNINKLLKLIPSVNTNQELREQLILSDFNYSYISSHIIDNEIKYIYHLMLDFSDNLIK